MRNWGDEAPFELVPKDAVDDKVDTAVESDLESKEIQGNTKEEYKPAGYW